MTRKIIAQKVNLLAWAKKHYGDNAPCMNTLRGWARSGRIQPAPVKTGRSYMVQMNAQYAPKKLPSKPPSRSHLKPLTNEQIDAITDPYWGMHDCADVLHMRYRGYARVIEEAHGILNPNGMPPADIRETRGTHAGC